MKFIKVLITGLLLGAIVATTASCGSSKNTAAKSQTYTVARGNISVDITAAGNLALSTIQDLTFAQFYALGTVGSVNVAVGDTVTKGEVLASLDQSEWNDQIQTLQDALTAAQRDVTTKQRTLDTARRQVVTQTRLVATKQEAVATAQRQATSAQMALQQAQIDIDSANNTLNKITDVKQIQDRIDNDNFTIKYAKLIASGDLEFGGSLNTNVDYAYWYGIVTSAQADLAQAQKDMQNLLNGNTLPSSEDVAIQLAQAQLTLQVKQMALQTAQVAANDAVLAVNDANTAVTNAQQDLTFNQQDVTNAQSDLNISNQKEASTQDTLSQAQASSPDILAPFDGIVTKVNVAGGDQVYKGAVAVTIADPNKFQASILVSEMNISQVKVGGAGTIAVDAIPGITLSANVTQIAPTATIQSGVVNYAVQVQVGSIIPTTTRSFSGNTTQPSGNGSPFSGNISQSQLSALLQAAVKAGRITQAQADTILKNGPSTADLAQLFAGSGNSTQGQGFPSGGFSRSQSSAATSQNVQLRDGMTVTVSIIVASRTNVIVVPNGAITTKNGQNYVQVITASGALEQRAVQTGLSDNQNTEITSGLSEGEKVSIPLGSTTSSTSSSSSNRGGGGIPFIGGIGR